jgi:hypothetical protein
MKLIDFFGAILFALVIGAGVYWFLKTFVLGLTAKKPKEKDLPNE